MLADDTLVELHVHGTLDDGTVFDSSRGRRAKVFVLGRGQMLPTLESLLRSMHPGERRQVHLEPDQAYGALDPSLQYRVPRSEAPPGVAIGDMLQLTSGRPATVVAADVQSVTVDANHPLAGRALDFEVELLSARPVPA